MGTVGHAHPRPFVGSLRDRILTSRRDFTLDLFTRSGEFWEAVALIRHRWRISSSNKVPDHSTAYRCPGSLLVLYVPPAWPRDLPPSPLPNTWPDFWHVMEVVPGEVLAIDPTSVVEVPHSLIEWYLDLKRLHDLYVPESARIPAMPYREGPWTAFLSACVLYDPPADRLLAFANHRLPELFVRSAKGGGVPTRESLLPTGPQQVGGPVAYLEDTQEIEAALEARFAEVWAFLRDHAMMAHRLDLDNLLVEASEARRAQWEAIWERFGDRMARVSKRAYIAVEPDTTRDDVTDAFKVLKRGFPSQPMGRPERDQLMCVQTAVWNDRFHMTNQDIARRFGWKMSARDGSKPRSERVRDHIAEGRRILAQRKPAV